MAKHAAPRDHSFLISVGKHLGAAVGLVAVVAAAFWGIGQIQAEEPASDGPVIANPSEDSGDPEPTAPASDDASEPSDAPATDEPSTEPTSEPTTAPTSEPVSEPSDPDPTDPEPTQTDDDGRIDPSSVSVQVLDAVLDGSSTAADVQERMRDAGYRVVARNKASKTYEVTTVFYSAGFEAQAQQIADEFGWSRVEPKPDNLSDSVQVHVVVGADEA